MLQDQIGPVFLAMLSLIFGVYGVRELALACRPWPFDEWIERALPGAGAVTLSAVFAGCSYRLIETAVGVQSVITWALH